MISVVPKSKEAKLIQEVVDLADASDTELSEWDDNFIADLKQKLLKYGDDMHLSSKQEEQLDRIKEKLEQ